MYVPKQSSANMTCWCILFIASTVFVGLSYGQMRNNNEQIYKSLQAYLSSKKYNRYTRPYFGEKPAQIEIFLFVSSVRSVSELTMAFEVELYFREYWKDPRLRLRQLRGKSANFTNRVALHESLVDYLWVPDTFLPNSIFSGNPASSSITHRRLLRLNSDGYLLLSRRISVTTECPMDLSLYPFDQQTCTLSIESYGYPIEDVIYKWRGSTPVSMNDDLELPQFKIAKVVTFTRNITLATGIYSRLECCFYLERSTGFHFVQMFIPMTAMTLTSFIMIWLEETTSFSDMISVIVAITFLYYYCNSIMPKVSYIKAMDLYLTACFIFVFVALIKLTVIKYKKLTTAGRKQKVPQSGSSLPSPVSNGSAVTASPHHVKQVKVNDESKRKLSVSRATQMPGSEPIKLPKPKNISLATQQYPRTKTQRVLRALALAFPVSFLAFGLCFFIAYYLIGNKGTNRNCNF